MSEARAEFFPSSQGLSLQSCAVAASAISQGPVECFQELDKNNTSITEKLESKRLELKANEGERVELTTEVRSLQNSAENDKLMIHGSMKALKDGEEFLNKQLTEMEELRYNLLEAFEKDAVEVATLFFSAPANFASERVKEDIQEESSQADVICAHINKDLDPKIKTAENLMAKEPVSLFEFPGSSPEELTHKDLDIFLSKLKENGQSFNQGIQGMQQESRALEQEENSI